MTVQRIAAAAVALLIRSSFAAAQATRPAAAVPTNVTPTGNLGIVRDVVKQMDLPADEKERIDGILDGAVADIRDAGREMVKATAPADRAAKFKAMGKLSDDAKDQVEAELTDAQKPAYAKRLAGLSVDRARKQIDGLKDAVGKVDLTDDEKADVGAAFDKAAKAMGDVAPAAKAAADIPAATAVQKALAEAGVACEKQILHTLGHDKFMAVERAVIRQRAANRPPTSRPAE